jgi:hypothetical protein
MEKRIETKIESHITCFKKAIQIWFEENNADISGSHTKNDFLQFVFDYDGLKLSKEDFQRRKRSKNIVPQQDRCIAKRANGDQCTRRKLSENFCGTHSKGTPHGIMQESEVVKEPVVEKIEIWMQDIKGICYYIDKNHNIYSPEDIVEAKKNPKIIGKWIEQENNIIISTMKLN